MSSRKRLRDQRRSRRIRTSFEDLVRLQAELRSAEGCPWDREQTHETLRTYLLEETYEVLEAIEARDSSKLASELGDLLLQIVFHAQLGREEGRFDIADVIEGIHSKMVRRHPHVFGAAKAENSAAVLKNWEQLKVEERQAHGREPARDSKAGTSILDGVPRTLPALLEAYQLTRRASHIGFDWDDIDALLEKLKEETAELREQLAVSGAAARSAAGPARLEEEVGDLLFVAVNVARFLGVDPEVALKNANRKFTARFQQMEQEMVRRSGRLADAPKEEKETLWARAKDKV